MTKLSPSDIQFICLTILLLASSVQLMKIETLLSKILKLLEDNEEREHLSAILGGL